MSRPLSLTVAVGTRPEVIKLAPVVAALRGADHRVRCVATGQHRDRRMYADVFADLDCAPDAVWALGAGDEGDRVGRLLTHAYADISAYPPDAVLVLGDTYTAPLVAMAARRAGLGVVHVEAGLRSFNERSMEECNRRMVAALATVHLAPTELAERFLLEEGVPAERIRVVGNPVVDAVRRSGVRPTPPETRRGVLVTAHRATNVDDPGRLRTLVDILERLATSVRFGSSRAVGTRRETHTRGDEQVLFPVHPRTRDRLAAYGWWAELARVPALRLVEPLPYAEMLARIATSRLVVTDSGGLQEEAACLGVPVVVMRSTTPRWEGVASGAAVLAGLDTGAVAEAVRHYLEPDEQARVAALPCPYGDGDAALRIVAALAEPEVRAVLVPRDPALATAGVAMPQRSRVPAAATSGLPNMADFGVPG